MALLSDLDSIFKALSCIDVANAKASVQKDEDTIKELVQQHLGFHEVRYLQVHLCMCTYGFMWRGHDVVIM